jgi:hypothetical protein
MAHDLFVAGLEPQRVSRLRDISTELGKAYFGQLRSEAQEIDDHTTAVIAATCFRRSAAHSLLLGDTGMASEMFFMAAQAYDKYFPSYSVVMSVLAARGAVQLPRILHVTSSGQMIYPMILALQFPEKYMDRLRELRRIVDAFRGARLGVLALPIEKFIDVFDALSDGIESAEVEKEGLTTVLMPFIESYASAFIRAKRDTFHWARLVTPFHPLEPDVVGVLLLVQQALNRIDVLIENLIARLPIPREPLGVLLHVLSLYSRNHRSNDGSEI